MEMTIKKDGDAITRTPLSNYCRTGESSTSLRYDNYVPLDYIRAELIDFDTSTLLRNQNLNFTEPINTDTGEVETQSDKDGKPKLPKRTAKTNAGLIFLYYPHNGRTFMSGSLHKFWNNGEHNYNDFDYRAFLSVLRRLYTNYGVLPYQIKINQLEWGVNIIPPIPPNKILDHCLFHRWKPFESKYNSDNGKYIQAEHKDYYLLKFYNKSLHYSLPEGDDEILRIERKQIAYNKHSKHNGIGQTMHDLVQSNFKGLKSTLIDNWNETLMYDPLLRTTDPDKYKLRDINTWREILENCSRTTRKKYADKLRKHNIDLGVNIQGIITELIKSKLTELNSLDFTFSALSYNSNSSTLNTLSNTKQCALTGVDISMQKDDSTFLSHKGLKHLLENDIDKFTEVKNEFLPSRYHSSCITVQIENIAKRIRNRYNDRFKRSVLRLRERENQYDIFTDKPQGIIARHYPLCA